jgi:hypothetical protein
MVGLKEIGFSPAKSGMKHFSLDIKKSQDVENVTPN